MKILKLAIRMLMGGWFKGEREDTKNISAKVAKRLFNETSASNVIKFYLIHRREAEKS